MLRLHAGFNTFALPAVLAAVGVFSGGSAAPSSSDALVRVSLSATAVEYGQKVSARGVVPTGTAGVVRIFTVSPSGTAKLTARAAITRAHTWKATFRALQPGRVFAKSQAGAAVPQIAAYSRPLLRIRQKITFAHHGGIVTNKPVRIQGTVLPRGRRLVRVTGSRGLRRSIRTARDGRFHLYTSAAVASAGVSAHALRSKSFLSSRARTVRVARYRAAVASFYDDYGLPVACGGVLGRNQVGVAHKTLRCGTRLKIWYRGRSISARVIDRGPYISGREFDLTGAAARALHFDGVGTIWVSR